MLSLVSGEIEEYAAQHWTSLQPLLVKLGLRPHKPLLADGLISPVTDDPLAFSPPLAIDEAIRRLVRGPEHLSRAVRAERRWDGR